MKQSGQGLLRPNELGRLLSAPLGGKLLGVEPSAAVYVKNGFRLLGAPAWVDDEGLERASSRFRATYRLDPAVALEMGIPTGYECHVPPSDASECVDRLRDPRHRLVCELFWPHVPMEIYGRAPDPRHIAHPKAVQALTDAAASHNGRAALLVKHALAIAHHNLAIAHELAFGTGQQGWTDAHWGRALELWGETLGAEEFWRYIRERVAAFDDPRARPADVDALQRQLPVVILGFNALFARTYAEAGDDKACYRHLALIHKSALAPDAKREVVVGSVRSIAVHRLVPLIERARDTLLPASHRFSRTEFRRACAPLLDEAFAARDHLVGDLHLSEDLVGLTEFDRLCGVILDAINGKVDYGNDDRERSILYGLLLTRRMLRLPLSNHMRHKLEEAVHSDTEHLYRDFLPSGDFDAAACWFMEGQEADPDASFVIPIHKITGREVKVDPSDMTAGVEVSFNSRRLLIPRSAAAKAAQAGSAGTDQLLRDLVARGAAAQAWTPPHPAAANPFTFADGSKAPSVLEVLEANARMPAAMELHVREGHLTHWFQYRGQMALAAVFRALEQGRGTRKDIHAALLQAAAAEVQDTASKVNARVATELERLGKERDAELAREQQTLAPALQRLEAQAAADREAVERVRRHHTHQARAEQTRRDAAIAQIRALAAGPLGQLEQNLAGVVQQNRGLRGGLRLELPLIAAFLAVFGGGGLAVGVLELVPLLPFAVPVAAGAALGLILSLGVGRAVRARRIGVAAAARDAAQAELETETAKLRTASDRILRHCKAEAEKAMAAPGARLKSLEADKRRLKKEHASRLAALRRKHERAAEAHKAALTREVEALRQRLKARVGARPESDQRKFPPYGRARSAGFSEGKEPTSSEMQMTSSERQQAQQRLQLQSLLHGVRRW